MNWGKRFPIKGKKIMISVVLSAAVVVAKAVNLNNHIAA